MPYYRLQVNYVKLRLSIINVKTCLKHVIRYTFTISGDSGRFSNAMNISSPASFGFAMPDMGFFGVASPPNYYKVL